MRRDGEAPVPEGLPPKVVDVYQAVGKIMSRYSAGKVPKAFKLIPTLKNWEEVGCPLPLAQQAVLRHVHHSIMLTLHTKAGSVLVVISSSQQWDSSPPIAACKQ